MKSRSCVLRRPCAFLLAFLLASGSVFAAWEARPGTIKAFAKKRPTKSQRSIPPELLQALQAELVEDHEAFAMLQMPLPNASAAPEILRRDVSDIVQILDEFDILLFSSFPVDARLPEPSYPAEWRRDTFLTPPARDAFVLQFASPPRQSWIDELLAAGATILDSVPYHGYIVLGDHEAIRKIVERLPVQLFRVHQPIHKVSAAVREAPDLFTDMPDPFTDVVVSVANVPEAEDVLAFLASSTLEELRPPEPSGDRTLHRITIVTSAISQLAALPAVLWVGPRGAPAIPSGQREANLTIGDTLITTAPVLKPILADHRAWIVSKDLGNYTQKVKMAILDTGFDTASDDGVPASFHPDFRKSDGSGTFVTVKRYTTGPGYNADCSGHGTFVAGVLAGNAGVQFISTQTRDCPSPCSDAPYLMGLGVVPEVPLVVGRVFNYLASNPTPRGFDNQDFTTIFSDLASQGVAITSNSWNRPNDTLYDENTEKLDKLVRSASGSNNGPPMAMYFSAGNRDDATNGNQYVSWPAFAKNVITVGASENFNSSSYTDYPPSNGYANADNGNQIWIYSQQGPTRPGADNRIKPDLVAPGSGMESPMTRNSAFGTASCCIGSCTLQQETVGPVGAVIDSTSGQGHLWSRGTSFATPAAAGAGALLYTWFKNKNVTPRPSLLKATQISLARPLTGTGQLPPGDKQGWGKTDLTRLTPALQPSDPYEWNNEDTVVTPFMTATLPSPGGSYRILDTTQPVRITVVWTDAPGDPGAGRELVNDLDLTVMIHGAAGHFALGNNFAASGRSTIFITGVSSGTPDTKNNVEQVVFLAAEAGNSTQFHVELFGSDIMEDGIGVWPPTGPLRQDFALFIENAVAVPAGATVFNTVAPCRVLDTRDADGPYGGPALTGNTVRSFALWNRCGIPPTAKAVSVNLTAVVPDADGYITAFPGGTAQPNVSTMSYLTGRVRANNGILSLGATGQISVFASLGTTHFILDVNGYFD